MNTTIYSVNLSIQCQHERMWSRTIPQFSCSIISVCETDLMNTIFSFLHSESQSVAPCLSVVYLFKVNSRNTRARCKICSKLTIKTPERRHWRCSGVLIVNFEHILHLVLIFLLLTLSIKLLLGRFRIFSNICYGAFLQK